MPIRAIGDRQMYANENEHLLNGKGKQLPQKEFFTCRFDIQKSWPVLAVLREDFVQSPLISAMLR